MTRFTDIKLSCLNLQPKHRIPASSDYHFFKLNNDLWLDQTTRFEGSVQLGLCASSDALFLQFEVQEPPSMYPPRTAAQSNGDPVYEDSCVEFFFQPHGAEHYLNLEMNADGVYLAGFGTHRDGRTSIEAKLAPYIELTPSSGSIEGTAERTWRMHVRIDLKVLRLFFPAYDCERTETMELKFNAYKCGDRTAEPHYVSLFPVTSVEPNFHRPEDFGSLTIDRINHE